MSIAKHHAEWLSLIEVSGPFLSLPVLVQHFPAGMDVHDPEHARVLRQVHEEWDQDQNGERPDRAIHRQWIDWVLRNTLDLGEVLVEGQDIPQTLKADLPEHGETLRPDKVVMEPGETKARLLIQTYPLRQKLGRVVEGKPWAASPDTRMMQLLHDTGVRLGLVTNGDQWMLVDAPKGETTGYASWFAPLWLEEPKTLQAFRTLLSLHRFFGVPEEETLERLLAQSAQDQQEVTDQLGYQVRRAVEVLVSSIDKANRDHGGTLLKGVPEPVLYEAALTVMMRLVFLFCAEERDLLLLGDELYDKNYAVSTLREQLQGTATDFGEEVLERRHDAWSRLLTTFRAVYSGVRHDRLKIPAYKGKLFDPDRFPFLEGRPANTSWKETPGQPLPVDNRTVLHLLEALQMLQIKLPGGGPATPRKLSFRALQITQIGHVYEGLLDHTAVRASEPVLGLGGSRNSEPEVALSRLEALAAKGEDDLLKFVKDETGRSSAATVKRLLASNLDDQALGRFRTACQGDEKLWERVRPFAGLVRLDTFDYPVVIPAGGVYVTAGTDRRSSGTHYTPESLTEPIVRHTLEPLVYVGPAEGTPRDQWKLKSAADLLDLKICDMACGSGAFLVQVCVYLADRLVEAWAAESARAQTGQQAEMFSQVEKNRPFLMRITPYGAPSKGDLFEQLVPIDAEERTAFARRIVAERCLYGVDKNPLAVEMAKLSLWLLTLAKDKPFTFLDHAIRPGDSLVGVDAEQLQTFSLDRKGEGMTRAGGEVVYYNTFLGMVPKIMGITRQQRIRLEKSVNFEEKQDLFGHIRKDTQRLNYAADRLMAASWKPAGRAERTAFLKEALREVDDRIRDVDPDILEADGQAHREVVGCPQPFHWALEFPEVFLDRGGFDAFVGNPPFMGGQKITGNLGNDYRDHLVEHLAHGKRGSADLCAYFFLRVEGLLRPGGQCGLVATNTIAQGDTREVGLDQLTANGCVIPRAVSSRKWPGTASLEVAHVWLMKGNWSSPAVLDQNAVEGITASLTELGSLTGSPQTLLANAGKAWLGSTILGMGFLLDPQQARELLHSNAGYSDVIMPCLNGEDLNLHPDHHPSRWVINFFDWPLDRASTPQGYKGSIASDYPECLAIVEEKVKPERALNKDKRRREIWWQFTRPVSELYRLLSSQKSVLVRSRICNHHAIASVPMGWVYTGNLVVFPNCQFSLIQSNVHEVWARKYSSSLKSDMQYTPTDCFNSFPFPDCTNGFEEVGLNYESHRRQTMQARQEGLTKTYHHFHDIKQSAADIQKLRDLHVEMDLAVVAAYGWSDLGLDHGFHETKQGTRFTISESARREVLSRLLKLNHERYAEEFAQGLHDKKKSKSASTPRKSKGEAASEPSLFGEED